MHNEISRRDVISIAGAAGGLALTGGLRGAWAQGAMRIEQLVPELAKIIDTNKIDDLRVKIRQALSLYRSLLFMQPAFWVYQFQQAEKERGRQLGRELTPDEREAQAARLTIELALARAKADLASARTPAHKRMLAAAIAALEQQLEKSL